MRKNFLVDIAKLSEPQLGVIKSLHQHPFVLYGGASSVGKTYLQVAGMAYLNMLYATHGSKNPITGLATTDSASVTERYGDAINKLLVQTGLGEIRGRNKEGAAGFYFNNPNYGHIRFISLFNSKGAKGKAPWACAIDELSLLPEQTWWDLIPYVRFQGNGRNPFPHINVLLCGSNPDGEFAQWVTEFFVTKTFNTKLGRTATIDPESYHFIQAKLSDNPNKEFVEGQTKNLAGLPEAQRAALLEGHWSTQKGKRFDPLPKYRDETFKPEPHWVKVGGLDWGYQDNSAIVWAAIDETGHMHVYDEYVGNEKTGEEIAKICRNNPARFYACDETMWKTESNGRQIIDAWRGLKVKPAPNKGHPGTKAIVQRIENNRITIYGCSELYRCLQGLSYGPFPTVENLRPHDLTHLVYALGYACYHSENLVTTVTEQIDPYEKWQRDRIARSRLLRQHARSRTISL